MHHATQLISYDSFLHFGSPALWRAETDSLQNLPELEMLFLNSSKTTAEKKEAMFVLLLPETSSAHHACANTKTWWRIGLIYAAAAVGFKPG